MGTVPPGELARLWAGEQLPVETATGQILPHLVRMQATLEAPRTPARQPALGC